MTFPPKIRHFQNYRIDISYKLRFSKNKLRILRKKGQTYLINEFTSYMAFNIKTTRYINSHVKLTINFNDNIDTYFYAG